MTFDPALFRDVADFRADVQQLCDDLRATPPIDSTKPVLVAGDPERAVMAERMSGGVPIGPGLVRRLREIAKESNADWVFGEVAEGRAPVI
jgi:LDH2 family malate/lactate/ureidoglycolate dehydrogenase